MSSAAVGSGSGASQPMNVSNTPVIQTTVVDGYTGRRIVSHPGGSPNRQHTSVTTLVTYIADDIRDLPRVELVELTIDYMFTGADQYININYLYAPSLTSIASAAMEPGGIAASSGSVNDHAKTGRFIYTPSIYDAQIFPTSAITSVPTLYLGFHGGVRVSMVIKWKSVVPPTKRSAFTMSPLN